MKLQDLVRFDQSLKFIHNPEWPEEILAISALDAPLEKSIVFVKNSKFLNRFKAKFDELAGLKIGAIIDEKFFSNISPEDKELLQKLSWFGTSSNVAMALTLLSKPFYDRKFAGMNSQADGRQMGTTDINPTAQISQNVFIGEHVKIGANVEILPGAVILSNVEIGDNTKIHGNVTVYPFTKIGKGCRIHSGTVIGADGFGYTFHQGQHHKIWHMGGVEIGDDVEIGSNTSIDQGTFSPTRIGSGTRIDNLVQIAHNCKIGKGCILCGQVGLAGSVTFEDYVVVGGQAAIGPDAHIGMGTQIGGKAGVMEAAVWPAGSKIAGFPARDLKEWLRGLALAKKLAEK
ncbi:MAG: UDP-3-O-(3-hydroxymyristoyl)glucosamine N-acyltransferase [Bdellovibrionota bacterium]